MRKGKVLKYVGEAMMLIFGILIVFVFIGKCNTATLNQQIGYDRFPDYSSGYIFILFFPFIFGCAFYSRGKDIVKRVSESSGDATVTCDPPVLDKSMVSVVASTEANDIPTTEKSEAVGIADVDKKRRTKRTLIIHACVVAVVILVVAIAHNIISDYITLRVMEARAEGYDEGYEKRSEQAIGEMEELQKAIDKEKLAIQTEAYNHGYLLGSREAVYGIVDKVYSGYVSNLADFIDKFIMYRGQFPDKNDNPYIEDLKTSNPAVSSNQPRDINSIVELTGKTVYETYSAADRFYRTYGYEPEWCAQLRESPTHHEDYTAWAAEQDKRFAQYDEAEAFYLENGYNSEAYEAMRQDPMHHLNFAEWQMARNGGAVYDDNYTPWGYANDETKDFFIWSMDRVADEWASTWAYSNTQEDLRRKSDGLMPIALAKQYDLSDPTQLYLYERGWPKAGLK